MKKIFFFLFFFLICQPLVAFEISGYYENDLLALAKKDESLVVGDLNRLRLRFDAALGTVINFHLEPRYYSLIKSQNLSLAGVSSLDQLVFDRAYLKANFSSFAITAGKQRIAWGSGYLWNPTDIFNPWVLSFAVREEEENNVEAVRLEVPLGAASGLDAYLTTNAPFQKLKKGIRAKTNLGLFDFSASYVNLGGAGFQVGFDTVGEVSGVGVRSEMALKSPASGSKYLQLVLGADYTLENGLGINLEYFFSGAGKKDKNNYDWLGLSAGTISQLGQDYLFLGLNKIIDEITEVSFSFLTNLNDGSFLVYPSLTRNIFQNVDLNLEMMLTRGQAGSEFNPGPVYDPSGFFGSKLFLIRITYNF